AIKLFEQPKSNVTIHIIPPKTLVTSVKKVVFTKQDYYKPRTIRVWYNKNVRSTGTKIVYIRHSARSLDKNYDYTKVSSIKVKITDRYTLGGNKSVSKQPIKATAVTSRPAPTKTPKPKPTTPTKVTKPA